MAYVADFALEDGARDVGSHHGTNVAAIVGGVAPETALLGLDVFGSGGTASITDIFSAFDWVINNQATYNIVAVNMSLGSGAYSATCTGSYWDSPTQELLDAGVLPVASSGNSSLISQIGGPACAPAVASVGAVYKQTYGTVRWSGCTDTSATASSVTCFSNSAPFLDLLAPGAIIDAAGISMGGTSQAAPHVAGAVAVLAGAYPLEGPSDWLERLSSTGILTEDQRNGVQTPLIDLPAALAEAEACAASLSAIEGTTAGPGENSLTLTVEAAAGCAWRLNRTQSWLTLLPSEGTGSTTVEAHFPSNSDAEREVEVYIGRASVVLTQEENDIPSGTLAAESGNPYTRERNVTLRIVGEDASGIASMCVNLGTGCSWVPFAESFSLRLPNTQGRHTARARFRDIHGSVSDWATQELTLDNGIPTGGSMELTPSEGALLVEWDGFADRLSPITTYHLAISADGDAAVCGGTDEVWSGTGNHHELTGLANGVPLAVRLCATDAAGNQSGIDSFTLVGEPPGESNPVQINAGAQWTRSKAVRISLTPTSGTPSRVCISNSTTCTAWRSYASSFGWNLLAGQGQRSVFVWFSDVEGAVSGPFWDPIVVDNIRPLHSAFSINEEDEALSLTWSISDPTSGIQRIDVYGTPGTRAPSCGIGTLLATTTEDTVRLEGLTNGESWGIRVCATDQAGNRSRGSALVATPRSEHNPPTGSLQIAGGAENTASRAVELTLSGTDDTGLSQMCISNGTSCTTWQAWAPRLSWNLTSGYGTKRVRLWLRDLNGNIGGPLTDTIEFAP